MPFFRRRRRFSATPRRSWRRFSTRSQTVEAKSNQANILLEQGLEIVQPIDSNRQLMKESPSFIVQALTPWVNAPPGGFDRKWELKGLIFSITAYPTNYLLEDSTLKFGLYPAIEPQNAYCPFGAMFFVDAAQSDGAPQSHFDPPLGPFVSTPPIASISGGQRDDEFLPTRIIKRKMGQIQTGAVSQASTGSAAYAVGISNFRWSGSLRKRITVGQRQGLFLGFYGIPPLGGFGEDNSVPVESAGIALLTHLTYYYRLIR